MLYITLFLVSLALILIIKPTWSLKKQILIFVSGIILTIASFWIYDIFISNEFIAKGKEDRDYIFEGILFIVMLGGMASKYFFDEIDKEEFKFNTRKLLKPMFIAPIAFGVVLSQLNEINMNSWMTYIFAFQNGFFWQNIFDKKQKEKA